MILSDESSLFIENLKTNDSRSSRDAEILVMGRRRDDECFGLPRGGSIFGLFIGIIIIFVGLQQAFGWNIDVGPFAIIIVGLLMAAGALYGLVRRRS